MGSIYGVRAIWPRHGQPWGVAEDKRLRRLHKKLSRGAASTGKGMSLYARIGTILGRTPCAVSTRLSTLKAIDAHLRARRRGAAR